MSNQRLTAVGLGLALVVSCAAGARAEDKKKNRETFTATVLQQANMRLPRGGTFQSAPWPRSYGAAGAALGACWGS